MFINKLKKQNPKLIKAAISLYKKLEPNTYVVDLDAVKQNAKLISDEAKKYNIKLYQMTKQFGRNPLIAKEIAKSGIKKVVAVDAWEAMVMIKNNIPLGNVGHLVQTPKKFLEPIIKAKPEVMTVFSLEKTKEISQIALKNNLVQDILVKVVASNDRIYPGQEGGVKISVFKDFLNNIKGLKGINLIGVTSFPCILYENNKIQVTNNAKTLHRAINIAKENGFFLSHINMPSASCVKTMKLISQNGGSHAEPGHALTGTTPMHAKNNNAETPAMLYISEVSHMYENKAYFFGGGHYNRSKMENIILVSQNKQKIQKTISLSPEAIDYYLGFEIKNSKPKVGDIVIGAFRTQVFVTRAKVAVVSGIQSGKPKIKGIYTALGEKIEQ